MKIHRIAGPAGLLLVLAMAQASVSEADEIKVLCSTPLRHVMEELVPQFERATKHQVVVTYGPSPELRQKIDGGAPFDLAVLTPALMDGLVKEGKIAQTRDASPQEWASRYARRRKRNHTTAR